MYRVLAAQEMLDRGRALKTLLSAALPCQARPPPWSTGSGAQDGIVACGVTRPAATWTIKEANAL